MGLDDAPLVATCIKGTSRTTTSTTTADVPEEFEDHKDSEPKDDFVA